MKCPKVCSKEALGWGWGQLEEEGLPELLSLVQTHRKLTNEEIFVTSICL